MTQTVEEKIQILESLDALLEQKFNGEYEEGEMVRLRKDINAIVPTARSIVIETKCLKLVNVAPPPAIGGQALQNLNPFDMIFNSSFGMSFIPIIRDMLQQAVGVLRAGGLTDINSRSGEEERMVYKPLEVPERVTLGWLVHNIPIRLWTMAGGILIAMFALGIKASAWHFVRDILSLTSCA